MREWSALWQAVGWGGGDLHEIPILLSSNASRPLFYHNRGHSRISSTYPRHLATHNLNVEGRAVFNILGVAHRIPILPVVRTVRILHIHIYLSN